jgi:hypothetical protein
MKGTHVMFRRATVLCVTAMAVLAMVGSAQAAMIDTFTDVSALQWDTNNTASSKTVSFSGTNTGVSFDITLATNLGNLVKSTYKTDMLADSAGINGKDWFEGILTVTVDNFTGAALGDITFQLVDVSGRRLLTDIIEFASTATPATNVVIGTGHTSDSPFSNVAMDGSAASMAGGQYVATLKWKNYDAETSGLYKSLSFEVTAVPEPATLGLLALGGLACRRRKIA